MQNSSYCPYETVWGSFLFLRALTLAWLLASAAWFGCFWNCYSPWIFTRFYRMVQKAEKNPLESGSSVGRNTQLIREVSGKLKLVSVDRKAKVTGITTFYNHGEQLRTYNMSDLEADTLQEQTNTSGSTSRTGIWVYGGYGLTKTRHFSPGLFLVFIWASQHEYTIFSQYTFLRNHRHHHTF